MQALVSELTACPVCGDDTTPAFRARVLNQHDVGYYFCGGCGLLRTETPYWLDEAYQSAISDTDTGILARNADNARLLSTLLPALGLADGRFVDAAGGYGLLARMLRDAGFDCYSTDKYCQNLFARGFEPDADLRADAVFAFEVLEHVADPMAFLSSLVDRYGSRTLVFSTLTFDGEPPPRKWWYYAFDTGQHISFYQPRTLALMAERLGSRYYPITSGLHLMTDRALTRTQRAIVSNRRIRRMYEMYLRRRSRERLTAADHRYMKALLGLGHAGGGDRED